MPEEKNFFTGLFDFSFSHSLLPRLVKLLYVLAIVFGGITAVACVVLGYQQSPAQGLINLVAGIVALFVGVLVVREPLAYPRTSGPQREFLPKIGNLGQHFLQVKIIRIAPLRNSPRQNADFQRVAAEGIGLQRRAIVSFGLQIPIHFLALVVGRNGVDGG